jgi:preprotein translocase SecE subunit
MTKKKSRLSFLPESIAELRKAHWSTRQELLRLSIMVLVLCILIGAILGILDYGFTELFRRLVIRG